MIDTAILIVLVLIVSFMGIAAAYATTFKK